MTATDGPRINQDEFVVTQRNKVIAILPDDILDACTSALARAGVDLSQVDVLQGDEGARILDFDGTEHGSWGHLVRSLQKLGTASNERENYDSALRNGNLVIAVPADDDEQANAYGKLLYDSGGRRIIHFARTSVERLSY